MLKLCYDCTIFLIVLVVSNAQIRYEIMMHRWMDLTCSVERLGLVGNWLLQRSEKKNGRQLIHHSAIRA